MNFHELCRQANEKIAQARTITERAEKEDRDMTVAEASKCKAILAEARDLQEQAEEDRRARTAISDEDLAAAGLQAGGRGSGMAFKDPSSGRILRALTNKERFSPREASGTLGEFLAAAVTGKMAGDMMASVVGGVDSSGGFMLAPKVGAQVIDLARSASVVMSAGAQSLQLDTPELRLVRLASDPVGTWRGETVAVPASRPTFESFVLRPRTLAAIVPASIEVLEDSSNIGSVLEGALGAAMGLAVDRAALIGKGSEAEPLGIQNHSGINTVGSVGTPTDYSKYVNAIGKIFQQNFPGQTTELAWVIHPRDAEKLDLLEDSTGQPLMKGPWISGVRQLMTTSLPTTLGAGAESLGIIGDFREVLLGWRTSGITIRILDAGSATDSAGTTWNAASQLLRLVVAYLRVDVALLQPKFLTTLTGITIT